MSLHDKKIIIKDFLFKILLTGYEVGYCVPAKAKWFNNGKKDCVCVPENGENACEVRYREQEFNFKMFPWNRNGADVAPFTIAVFGDLGLWKVPPKKVEN
jgi:hypothetical protein